MPMVEEQERKRQRTQYGPGSQEPDAAQPQGPNNKLVLVWDLDETLLIFNSLLTGSWAAAQQQQEAADDLLALGSRWEAAILKLCDEHLFFDQLEEFDQTCLADVQQYDDGASLAGYNWSSDGFPPPTQQPRQASSPQQHAAGVHPASYAGPAAAPAVADRAGEGQQAGAAEAAAPGSAASAPAASSPLEAAGSSEAAGGGAAAAGTTSSGSATPEGKGAQPPGSSLEPAQLLHAASLTRLAYRYRRILKLFSFGLQALGNAAQRQEWEALYTETDAVTGGWLSHASSLLSQCSSELAGSSSGDGGGNGSSSTSSREVVHVAVTSGQLIPSLAKLLLFKLSRHIKAEHLWSSRSHGKQHCFELVQRRFGGDCCYVAIGDGIEEDEAALHLGWPYVRVLLGPAEHYPAQHILGLRPDAATSGPGLPLTQLTVRHIEAAAALAGAPVARQGSLAAAGEQEGPRVQPAADAAVGSGGP